jgi:hypothetical protein
MSNFPWTTLLVHVFIVVNLLIILICDPNCLAPTQVCHVLRFVRVNLSLISSRLSLFECALCDNYLIINVCKALVLESSIVADLEGIDDYLLKEVGN